ncbi:MAG: BON domain-containing protein [Xanthomonadales bacterium]|nr:BON domain-containing protein [Xanthomonadales bacterium]
MPLALAGLVLMAGCAARQPEGSGEKVAPDQKPGALHPGIPSPLRPGSEDGEVVHSRDLSFHWESADHAEAYGLYVSEFRGGQWRLIYDSEVEHDRPLGTTTLKLPPGLLQNGGRYRWNVRGWNRDLGWGPLSQRLVFSIESRSDEELFRLISQRLDHAEGLDTHHVKIGVRDGKVSMVGCVPDEDQHRRVRRIALAVEGVVDSSFEKLRLC